MSNQFSFLLTGESFVRCGQCGEVRHRAQYGQSRGATYGRATVTIAGPDHRSTALIRSDCPRSERHDVCMFCAEPERYPYAGATGGKERAE